MTAETRRPASAPVFEIHVADLRHAPVHTHAHVPIPPQRVERGRLASSRVPPRSDRGLDEQARSLGPDQQERLDDVLRGARRDRLVADRAMRRADAREEHAEVVADLGRRRDGGARVPTGRALLDRERGPQPIDESPPGGFGSCAKKRRAWALSDSTYRRCPSAKIVWNASEDFPEPLGPVTTINASCGTRRSTPRRLCVRAPRTTSSRAGPRSGPGVRHAGAPPTVDTRGVGRVSCCAMRTAACIPETSIASAAPSACAAAAS